MPNFEKLDAYRVSILDVARLLPDARLPEGDAAKELANRAAAMLSKMSL